MLDLQRLRKTLARVTGLAKKHSSQGITEQDTKHALIDPVLEALGWSMTDLDVVRAEYRHMSKDNPVDYALFSNGHPVLFVEAKALDVSIADHKAVTQVITYANVSGVDWALLTNGKVWALYRVFATVQVDQKQLFSVDVSDPMAVEWLQCIVPSCLAGNDLHDMWRQRFAGRKLRVLLVKMIREQDSDLVGFLAHRSGLDPKDVRAGLHHLRVSFDEPKARPPDIDLIPVPIAKATVTSPAQEPEHKPTAPQGSDPLEGAGQEASINTPPLPGLKPTSLTIGDRVWSVRSWRELPVAACSYLAEVCPQKYERALDANEFQGRKRRALGRTSDSMRSPAEVPGGFVEVSLSAQDCVALVRRLLSFCGVDTESAKYEVR